MKKAKVLSIGIPVYNMEKYLTRCLDSVTQISHLSEIDIIVVNDGSTDGSLGIAREFEKRYPDSLSVIDKPNGGWGSAVNESIIRAKGKYFKTLDSDDWFENKGLDQFISILLQVDADVVLSSYNTVNENGDITGGYYFDEMIDDKAMSMEDYLFTNRETLNFSIHALTYRTALLQQHKVKIWERFYGDLDYICNPMVFVKSVYTTHINIYQYFYGREGQSVSIDGYNKHLDDYLNVVKKAISNKARYSDQLFRPLRQMLFHESYTQTCFAYKLLMQRKFNGGKKGWKRKLKEFDSFLKINNLPLYEEMNHAKVMKYIPFILIWRIFGINVFLLK